MAVLVAVACGTGEFPRLGSGRGLKVWQEVWHYIGTLSSPAIIITSLRNFLAAQEAPRSDAKHGITTKISLSSASLMTTKRLTACLFRLPSVIWTGGRCDDSSTESSHRVPGIAARGVQGNSWGRGATLIPHGATLMGQARLREGQRDARTRNA